MDRPGREIITLSPVDHDEGATEAVDRDAAEGGTR
jgi:hypothetical protein